jgi:polyisoprenyl-teichoic acid--peptidoglycan teichoic acid transferase
MKNFIRIMLLAEILLTGCGSLASAQTNAAQPALPFALVTVAPNASPTPTPFQPLGATSTSTPQPTPAGPTDTPTVTVPPPTETPLPTIDPAVLVNTLVPFSTIEASGNSQVLNNGQETVNFLLIGADRSMGTSFRTDTMVIAILRPLEGQVSLISIPRDLWVYIPGAENQRINTAYQRGGAELLKETILYNLGIRIDHTALVDFDGFRQIVDTLGGVDVPVSCSYTDWRLIDPSYDPQNENNWHLYTTGTGLLHMDGDMALWYARSRQKSNDFDRGRRQQEVLRALFNQALQADTLKRIPELYNNLNSTVETDLGLGDLLQLAIYAPKMTNADIRSYYIRPPYVSSWITNGGAYVLLPNEEMLQPLLTEAMSPSTRVVHKQSILIEVMNGTSIEGYDTLAASRLNYAGYETRIVPSDRTDYSNSVLIDKTIAQDLAQSDPILNVMGLLPGSIVSSPDPNSTMHYQLILGYDYEPCFKPENLGQ